MSQNASPPASMQEDARAAGQTEQPMQPGTVTGGGGPSETLHDLLVSKHLPNEWFALCKRGSG